MSYDIYLGIHTGKQMTDVVDIGNHTSNTNAMWFKALGYSLSDLDGRIAGEVISDLRKAIAHMQDNGNEYIVLNPSNGWGTYETALQYLKSILDACINHPLCTIIISH